MSVLLTRYGILVVLLTLAGCELMHARNPDSRNIGLSVEAVSKECRCRIRELDTATESDHKTTAGNK